MGGGGMEVLRREPDWGFSHRKLTATTGVFAGPGPFRGPPLQGLCTAGRPPVTRLRHASELL